MSTTEYDATIPIGNDKLFIDLGLYDFAAAIENLRIRRRCSLREFAKLAGMSASYLSDIINRKKIPQTNTLKSMCDNLDYSFDVFMIEAINEDRIKDEKKRELVRDIKTQLIEIAEGLSINIRDQQIE